jgi:hypothetical protein
MNIALAILAALAFNLTDYLPGTAAPWVAENLKNALIINVVLAVFRGAAGRRGLPACPARALRDANSQLVTDRAMEAWYHRSIA